MAHANTCRSPVRESSSAIDRYLHAPSDDPMAAGFVAAVGAAEGAVVPPAADPDVAGAQPASAAMSSTAVALETMATGK
jgi:hypothetical protein